MILLTSTTIEVWEWIINLIPHFTGYVITCPCWEYSSFMLVKGTTGSDEFQLIFRIISRLKEVFPCCTGCRGIRFTQLDSHHLRLTATVQSPEHETWGQTIQFINAHGHIGESIVLDKLVASVQSTMILGEWFHLGMCTTAVGRWEDTILSHLDFFSNVTYT